MRRSTGSVVLALGIGSLFALGCSKGTPSGSLDLAGITVDLARSTDMARTTVGIACGPATACAAQAQVCCSVDEGQTGSCVDGSGPCTGNNATYSCDGPEDCPPATKECCFTQNGRYVALCQSTGYCENRGLVLCHFDSDCASPAHCCPVPNSPYGACTAGPCS